ncbi:MAG: hypothetical protein SOW21_04340 [[Actinobacillus] rossii]|uniref:Uncharacterized protein n=1 Tax=[Actinobacillus] rossii TaxID=123820 RepID=A0A380TSQ0_9PAST|nr:hypothetical protein [[Actinobacillus] rossii]SUT91441.1 Uncharacterised protein [[Actinobacillus] rossii]SUT94208.1 Uncharacterised protein [[Actinobacillus] rossii]
MKFVGVFKRIFNWFKPKQKVHQNRPHFMSKNAWSYCKQGKLTPAMALYLKLGA